MPRSNSWRALYPFASQTLEFDGQAYHYLDEGSGEPLLMVHGNPTWSFYWRQLVQAFRPRYRCVVPDHIGCGLSSKPQQYNYTLSQHVANLCRLIETLDLRNITLLAHDWGGAIGMGAAVAMPERFARFALFNTGAFRSRRMPWRIAAGRIPVVGQLAIRGLNAFARAALSMATCRCGGLNADVAQGLIAPYDSWAHRVAVHQFVIDIPMHERHRSYATLLQIEQGLSQFRQHPVLLAWGMRDWCFTPAFLHRFVEFFPSAEVLELPEAGHYVIEDAPDEVIARVDQFLSEHPVGGPRS